MENARIVIFEDRERNLQYFNEVFDDSDHEIVATAQTRAEAMDVIDKVEFDVAIVDGNLDTFDEECSDGRVLTTHIRERKQGAKIIWFSSYDAKRLGIEHDADAEKDFFGTLQIVDNL